MPWGKYLGKSLARDVALVSRASLHHPYRFNRFKVDSQWVYLSRAEKERRALKRILGVDLGKDLDQNYTHVLLVIEIHEHGLEVACRIHKDAWWDGENLKRRAAQVEQREALAETPGRTGRLRDAGIHDFKRIHDCANITASEIKDMLGYYVPGEHWLHVCQEFPRDCGFVTEPGFAPRVEQEIRTLLPLYRFATWSPENNFLFDGA